MEKEQGSEKEECCSGGGCGCGCGGGGCRGAKAIVALIILLLGGVLGYLLGTVHMCKHMMCKSMMMSSCPMSAPQTPPSK